MRIGCKPPVLIPEQHIREIERISKAALMDLAWDYAVRCAGEEGALDEFRRSATTIENHRRDVKGTT